MGLELNLSIPFLINCYSLLLLLLILKLEVRLSHFKGPVRIRTAVCQLSGPGVEVRASASQSVDMGFIPFVESYQKTFKMVSIAFLLGARHLWEVVENKPASSFVVSLGKALIGTPPLLCGRQVA